MRIVACIKRVPDTEARIKIAEDGQRVDASGLKHIISPYDEYAVEAALRLRDAAGGDSLVTVVTVDREPAAEQLRTALAMGADEAVLLKAEPAMDGLETARVLAAELPGIGADLVLFGVKAVDDDQQQVGPMVAELLGWACVTAVADFELEDGRVEARREVEGGVEIVEAGLPLVVTLTKGIFEPRYPSLKGIMAAKRKSLAERDVELGNARLRVHALNYPPARPPGRVVGEGAEAVVELVRLLREEAKAI